MFRTKSNPAVLFCVKIINSLVCLLNLSLLTPFKVNIEGSGPASPVIAIADGVGRVRGVINNPKSDPPLKPNGKLDVSTVVGGGKFQVSVFLYK